MSKVITYKVEDIFQDIEGDDENVLMNIPPEISEKMGWVPGDVLKFKVEQGVITVEKVEKEVDNKDQIQYSSYSFTQLRNFYV